MKAIPVIVIQLVHILGPMKGDIQEFTQGSILIGRDPSCDLKFPADLAIISRKHAQIIREGNQFRLIDSSSNGTYVNGKRVKETSLNSGDVLEFAGGGPKVSFLSEIREDLDATLGLLPTPAQGYKQEPQAQPVQVSVQKVSAPLTILYGPTLRSYSELPVTIGRNPGCDFVLEHQFINDQHAQFFFNHNQYWVKDLTGQQALRINQRPLNVQAPLNINDEVSMSPRGPVFRFLGEGRLAEVEETAPPQKVEKAKPQEKRGEERPGKFWSKFKKMF